jgi:hypothetical protein
VKKTKTGRKANKKPTKGIRVEEKAMGRKVENERTRNWQNIIQIYYSV